jgi:hypothetical protein
MTVGEGKQDGSVLLTARGAAGASQRSRGVHGTGYVKSSLQWHVRLLDARLRGNDPLTVMSA